MRVFIAIDLPEEVKEEARKAQRQLKGAKFSFTNDFHITLKFLGELTPDKADEVKEKLKEIKFNKFAAAASLIGFFPDSAKIRVIWIGINPAAEIEGLQAQIDEKLKQQFPKEKGFKAHITIARVKLIDNKKELIDSINNVKTEKIEFNVDNFKLKKSTLTREGAVYEDLGIF